MTNPETRPCLVPDESPYVASEIRALAVAAVALVDRAVSQIQAARLHGDFESADELRTFLGGLAIEVRFDADGRAGWFVRDPNPAATRRFRSWLASQWAEMDHRAIPRRKEPRTNDQ